LHALPLDKNLFLITSATDQPPTSRWIPIGKRHHPETLASTPMFACVHAPAKKKAAAPLDLNLMVVYQFAWQALGRPLDLGRPSLDPPRSVQIPARNIFLDEFHYFCFTARFKNS
jgi:hypothetical protein